MKIKKSHRIHYQIVLDDILEKQYYDKLKHIKGVRKSILYHSCTINEDLLKVFDFIKTVEGRKRMLSSTEMFIDIPELYDLLFRSNSITDNLSGVNQISIMYNRLYDLCESLNYQIVDFSEYDEYRKKR